MQSQSVYPQQTGYPQQAGGYPQYVPTSYNTTTVTQTKPAVLPGSAAPAVVTTSTTYTRPQKQGLGQKLQGALNKLSVRAERQWNEATDERFRRYFGYPFTEQLYGEFWGELWNAGQMVACTLYLSAHHLSILAKLKDPVTHNKIPLKVAIPLIDITNVTPAVTLPASVAGAAPVLQPVSAATVRPDSLMIYTRDGNLHQFSRLYNFDKAFQTLNYLWHQASTNPNPGANLVRGQMLENQQLGPIQGIPPQAGGFNQGGYTDLNRNGIPDQLEGGRLNQGGYPAQAGGFPGQVPAVQQTTTTQTTTVRPL